VLPLIATAIAIALLIGAVIVGYGLAARSRLVATRNRVQEARQQIEATFERRATLVRQLVAVVESRFPDAVPATEAVLQQRQRCVAEAASPAARAAVEADLAAEIARLCTRAEADPALAADGDFRRVREELGQIGRDLDRSLPDYNRKVQRLDNLVERFPSSMLALLYGIGPADPFEPDAEASAASTPERAGLGASTEKTETRSDRTG